MLDEMDIAVCSSSAIYILWYVIIQKVSPHDLNNSIWKQLIIL